MYMKICVVGDVLDVITYAKFSGVTILQGVEFSIFPIDFEWALQQCSATALPVMKQEMMDGVVLASAAGPHANHLHLMPDR